VRPFPSIMKVLARVDPQGRVPLPANLRRQMGLRPNQVLELRALGPGPRRGLMLSPRTGR